MDGEANKTPASALSRQLEWVGIAAAALDADGRVLTANRQMVALLDLDADDVSGRPLEAMLKASAAATTKEHECWVFRFTSDGRDVWYRLDVFPHSGQALAMLVNITQERLAMQFTRFGSDEFQQLLQDAQIGVWRFDPDAEVYYFSSELSLGYRTEELTFPLERLNSVQHQEDAKRDAIARIRITTEGGAGEGEGRFMSASGEWVHMSSHYRAGRCLPSGRYEMVGISQNITRHAAVRDAATLSASRLKLALKAAKAAVFEYDYGKDKYWTSDEMRAMVGDDLWAQVPDHPLTIFEPEDRAAVRVVTLQIAHGAKSGTVDARLRTIGGPRWVRIYCEVENALDGRPRRTIGFVLDIHEQKQQEIALEEARRAAEAGAAAKSNFLASMSHEIRTPLNGVLGMAQSLYGDELTSAQREKVAVILDSGKTLMALLNDVLDLSKIEASKLEISPIDDDLRESVGRAAMLFRPGADEKGIVLDVDFDEAVPARLRFDPVRVRQCVSNLLSNAIKFSKIGGRVGLRLQASHLPDGGYHIAITISDSGIGMNEETLEKLFSQFSQADGSTSRRFGGSGLGLAISRQLARAMGGDIDVQSEYGEGSSFRLSFRADPAAVSRSASDTVNQGIGRQPGPECPLAGARVLLVDDNQVNRQVIKLFLAPSAVVISEAANGLEALANLKRATFDIVLLDVHMPVMDGCEAVRTIRASREVWRDVPVIALTADAMSGDKERYLAIGMTDYLAKPVDQRELISKIGAILAARREAAPIRSNAPAAPAKASDRIPTKVGGAAAAG